MSSSNQPLPLMAANRRITFESEPPRIVVVQPDGSTAPLPTRGAMPPPPTPPATVQHKVKTEVSQSTFTQRMQADRNPLATSSFKPGMALTMEEVSKHKTRKDCWMVVRGKVYDVTSYLPAHPGGKGELMRGAGKDATELYDKAHPWVNVDALIGKLCLGRLVKPTQLQPVEEVDSDESL